MMEKKNKLKKILNLLNPDDTSDAFKAFDVEAQKLKESLKEDIQAKTLEGVNLKLDRFRKAIDINPLVAQVRNIESEFNSKIQALSNLLDENSNHLRNLVTQGKDEGSNNLKKNISFVSSNIESLKSQISEMSLERDLKMTELQIGIRDLKNFQSQLDESLTKLSSSLEDNKSEQKTSSEQINLKVKSFNDAIESLRQEFLGRLSNLGGGNANRQINVKSSVMSTQYNDINFANGGGIVWTASDDTTNKRVNITASVISAGGGGSGNPGGNDTEIQYNDGGSFGGSSTLTWNKSTSILSATALDINGTSGTGYITLPNQSSNPPSVTAGNVRLHGFTTQGFTRLEQDNESTTNVILGRDLVTIARNTSGGDLAKGDVVYITGSTGNVPNIAKAQANSSATLPATFMVVDPITNGSFGQVMRNGILSEFNTSSFSAGQAVWLSPTVAGGLTGTRPSGTTNFIQRVGTILVSGVGNGSIDVNVAHGVLNMETGTNAATWTGSSIVGTVTTTNTLLVPGTTSGNVRILAASVAGNWTMTLPPNDGTANQVLTTDGNGITTWASVAATGGSGITRTSSIITDNTLGDETASIDRVYIANGGLCFTLPDAANNLNRYTVKNVTASVLVTAVGGDTIDGSASVLMALPNLAHDFISDNTNWHII